MGKLRLTSDQIGDLGELIAAVHISRPAGAPYRRALFRPVHLGGKYPLVDFLIDVLGPGDRSLGFFFAQVKTTFTASGTRDRLPVGIPKAQFNALSGLALPAYLIGVDAPTESAYIVAANKTVRADVPGIGKAYSLRLESVRIALYQEVVEFWEEKRHRPRRTRFTHA